ncbi:TonB-dependent receptor [Odoribacter sp. OttesenSCG-928-J03]|nr:TonB-dependent receptor [Odoribacter sp. OttesenSCG-928-J03]MDL2283466.1 TonB-dependent receptor [Odoribacter sp. OttesenSCG-928-G04]
MRYIFLWTILCLNYPLWALHTGNDRDTIAFRKTLEETTVVSEKRAANPIDLPIAVSVLKTMDIPVKNNLDIRSLSGLIPNFYMLEYGLKLSTPVFIRGIGTPTANPTIGLYVDGVPVFDKNTYVFDLYDVKQIEVLRGPQGTLQGRNTLGGMINILTNPPSRDFSLAFKAGYGSNNTQNYHMQLNLPATRNFYNKIFFAYNSSDGFFKNKWNGEKVDKSEGYTLRYQGRWMPGSDWDIKFGMNYYKTEDGGYGYYNPDSLKNEHYKVSFNSPSSYERDLISSYLNVKKDLSKMTLNLITSYSYYDDMQKNDQDYSELDIYYNEKPSHQNLVTQEITLQSKDNCRYLDWMVGGFGFYKDLTNRVTTNYNEDKNMVKLEIPGMPFPIPILASYVQDLYYNNTTTKGIAGFGQFTLKNILPGMFITAGIRYDLEHAKVDYRDQQIRTGNASKDTLIKQSKTNHEWLPKFSIIQKWNDRMSTYMTISKGYRAGGYNIVLNYNRNNLEYQSDNTWNYELGYKYVSRSNNFKLNAALFYIDWKDQQLFQMEMNAAVIKNGGDAYSTGAEMDLQWRFLPEFTYTLAMGYTHAEYADYSGKGMMGVEFDYDGNCLPMVPEYTFNTGVRYDKEIRNSFLKHVSASTNVSGIGEQYFNDANDGALRQKAYFLWNASCELDFAKHFTLELWAKNILNKHYFSYMLASPLSMVNESMKYLGQSGSPATFGASLSFSF